MFAENSEKNATGALHELMTTNDKPMKSTSISSSSVDLYTFENVDENHNSTILQSMKLNIPVNFNVLSRDLKNKELLHCKQSSL